MSTTNRTRYTACFLSGEPYYPDGRTFESLVDLRVDLAQVKGEIHTVTLGEVQVEEGTIYWPSWRKLENIEVGEYRHAWYAAVGSDGRRDVVWGLGVSEAAARQDAEAADYGGPEFRPELRIVEISREVSERIEAGEIDAERLGLAS